MKSIMIFALLLTASLNSFAQDDTRFLTHAECNIIINHDRKVATEQHSILKAYLESRNYNVVTDIDFARFSVDYKQTKHTTTIQFTKLDFNRTYPMKGFSNLGSKKRALKRAMKGIPACELML